MATEPVSTEPTATPTVRPTRTPTAVPTASPTPLPTGDDAFAEVKDGVALDVSKYKSIGGTGGYNSETKRVEINDAKNGDNSMGTWSLAECIPNFPEIKTGDEVTFRIQGYNYGNSGFRFWIGSDGSGGCTPVMLVDEVAEGQGILPEYGYPCVLDENGNVYENQAGESLQGMTTNNQMAINADPETKAFDITFT